MCKKIETKDVTGAKEEKEEVIQEERIMEKWKIYSKNLLNEENKYNLKENNAAERLF